MESDSPNLDCVHIYVEFFTQPPLAYEDTISYYSQRDFWDDFTFWLTDYQPGQAAQRRIFPLVPDSTDL